MGLGFGRQGELKSCAARGVVGTPNGALSGNTPENQELKFWLSST
jgi:hypothetical protein